MSKRRRGYP